MTAATETLLSIVLTDVEKVKAGGQELYGEDDDADDKDDETDDGGDSYDDDNDEDDDDWG